MFHVVAYRHPAGAWLAAQHGGGVLCFSLMRELADVVARRLEERGLETKVELWRPDQVGRLLADNGVREEAILRGRLLPLEAFAGGVGDCVAFAREVGERIVRVAFA